MTFVFFYERIILLGIFTIYLRKDGIVNNPRTERNYWITITRPIQVVLGGMAAWIAALLSDGPFWLSTQKIAVGGVMMLSILGASIWHYGARADIYARKHWDPVYVRSSATLLAIGAVSFAASIFLAWQFLPSECVAIAVANCLVILLYARFLDQYWPWKNLSIAAVCVTPLLLGWFSGHRLHPMVPPMIAGAFFFYLAREIFKDVVDLEANCGRRFTMVMDIGTLAALRVGGLTLMISVFIILFSFRFASNSAFVWVSCILGSFWLFWFAVQALRGENIANKFPLMDFGAATILISLLGVRLEMY